MANEIDQLSEKCYLSDIEKLISAGHSVKIPIEGNSMYPFLVDRRDCVFIKRESNIKIGDIVLVRMPDKQYILHRVYNIIHEQYILMGDGNIHAMEVCQQSNIIGKAYKIERNGRYIMPCSFSEEIKVALWRYLRPIRRYLMAVLSIIGKITKK